MKNKLINYLATGALIAGSLLPLSCEKRSLEGRVAQPGVQATQPIYEDPVLARVMGKLRQEYEKFDVSYSYEDKQNYDRFSIFGFNGDEVKLAEEHLKCEKSEMILEKEIKKHLEEMPTDILNYLSVKDVESPFWKANFINYKNPSLKDLVFFKKIENSIDLYLGLKCTKIKYKNLNWEDLRKTACLLRFEYIDAYREIKGKKFSNFDEELKKTAKKYETKYKKFPLNLKKQRDYVKQIMKKEAGKEIGDAMIRDYFFVFYSFFEFGNNFEKIGLIDYKKITPQDALFIGGNIYIPSSSSFFP